MVPIEKEREVYLTNSFGTVWVNPKDLARSKEPSLEPPNIIGKLLINSFQNSLVSRPFQLSQTSCPISRFREGKKLSTVPYILGIRSHPRGSRTSSSAPFLNIIQINIRSSVSNIYTCHPFLNLRSFPKHYPTSNSPTPFKHLSLKF